MPKLVLLLCAERDWCELMICPRFFRSDDCVDGVPCARAWDERRNVKLALEDVNGEPQFVGAIERPRKKREQGQ